MAYSHGQKKVINAIRREALRRYSKGGWTKAERRKLRSAFQTGRIESSFRNLSYGDGTSIGWRQETSSSYPNVNRRDVPASVKRYFNEVDAAYSGQTPAQLAQAVQRSAYPERYRTARGEAIKLTKRTIKGGAVPGGSASGKDTRIKKVITPGIDRSADRRQILMDYLDHRDEPTALLDTALGLREAQDVPRKVKTTRKTTGSQNGSQRPTTSPGGVPTGTKHLKGTASFEGTRVAAWIQPWLKYARQHGWKGTVNSGFRSYQDQLRIWNSGVRPAARPGTSNHEGKNFPRGAVDVSDAATLSRILKKAGAPLKWAGSKDPVHFSYPHDGAY